MQPYRVQPIAPVQAYKTYGIVSPKQTHTRPATCGEIECPAYLKGWVTRVPIGSELADYITSGAHGRRYRETTGLESAEREFLFEAGQPCFRAGTHRISLERPPLYVVRDGDFRGNPTGRKHQHVRPVDWVEDFGEHQQMIADRVEKG